MKYSMIFLTLNPHGSEFSINANHQSNFHSSIILANNSGYDVTTLKKIYADGKQEPYMVRGEYISNTVVSDMVSSAERDKVTIRQYMVDYIDNGNGMEKQHYEIHYIINRDDIRNNNIYIKELDLWIGRSENRDQLKEEAYYQVSRQASDVNDFLNQDGNAQIWATIQLTKELLKYEYRKEAVISIAGMKRRIPVFENPYNEIVVHVPSVTSDGEQIVTAMKLSDEEVNKFIDGETIFIDTEEGFYPLALADTSVKNSDIRSIHEEEINRRQGRSKSDVDHIKNQLKKQYEEEKNELIRNHKLIIEEKDNTINELKAIQDRLQIHTRLDMDERKVELDKKKIEIEEEALKHQEKKMLSEERKLLDQHEHDKYKMDNAAHISDNNVTKSSHGATTAGYGAASAGFKMLPVAVTAVTAVTLGVGGFVLANSGTSSGILALGGGIFETTMNVCDVVVGGIISTTGKVIKSVGGFIKSGIDKVCQWVGSAVSKVSSFFSNLI